MSRMKLSRPSLAWSWFTEVRPRPENPSMTVTVFPLFAHADEFVGVVAIFWRE